MIRILQTRQGSVTDARGDNGGDLFQESDVGRAPFHEIIQKVYANPYIPMSELSDLELLIPRDLVFEMAELSNLHRIVLGISRLDIREFLQLRARADVDACDVLGLTPLYNDAARGDTVAVQALLDAGAQPNFGQSKRRPLHIACRQGDLEVARKLIAAGADVNVRSEMGRTPLSWLGKTKGRYEIGGSKARGSDLVEIAAELIRHGADLLAEDEQKAAALEFARGTNNPELANFLIREGINIDHQDWEGSAVLMNAVAFNACETAGLLLERGAEYRIEDNNRYNALHYLAVFFFFDSEDTMAAVSRPGLVTGLDPRRENSARQTPLQTFEGRRNIKPGHREDFVRLLDVVSRPQTSIQGQKDESKRYL